MKSILSLVRILIFLSLTLLNRFKLYVNGVKTHKGISIRGSIFILNQGIINLGDNITINSSKYKNIIGGDTRSSIVVKRNACLTIGENLRMSNSAIYCAEKIEIGNNVMIGGSTKIWDTDFHPLNPHVRNDNPNDGFNTRPIIIDDNVFIGGFSIILKGSNIGKNSIIGAGSVVSGIIPPDEIWGGNPAKFIKKQDASKLNSN